MDILPFNLETEDMGHISADMSACGPAFYISDD
jgi:hypothetical protein